MFNVTGNKILIQRNADGETETIDMDAVDSTFNDFREGLKAGNYAKATNAAMEAAMKLDHRQLQFLTTMLAGMASEYARLWHSAFSLEHCEQVKKFHELQKQFADAGFPLWDMARPEKSVDTNSHDDDDRG
jgi:hypothetical protein